MRTFTRALVFLSLIVSFSVSGRNYVKLNLPERFDLVSTPKVPFGFEYSSKNNSLKQRGMMYDYPMSFSKFKKFDLHINGKPYRGSHKAIEVAPDLLHETNGVIPVSYRHPLNPKVVVEDTLLFPYPKEIGLDLKSISFSSPESLSLLVQYTNGTLHRYSYQNLIKFLDSYGMKLELLHGSLAYGVSSNRFYSLKERIEKDKMEANGVFRRHFSSRTFSNKVGRGNLFDVVLQPVGFKDELLGKSLGINLVSKGYQTTFSVPLLNRGSHELSFWGENGRSGFHGRRGSRGHRSSDIDINISPYNDSLYRYTVRSNNGQKEYVLNPKFAQLNVQTMGGNGGSGACGVSGACASGNRLYGEPGGNGADGGDGGDGGDINVYYPRSFLPFRNSLICRSQGGNGGSGGRAGSGGRHKNKGSNGCYLYAEDGYSGDSGRRGRSGRVNYQLID